VFRHFFHPVLSSVGIILGYQSYSFDNFLKFEAAAALGEKGAGHTVGLSLPLGIIQV
jgi:hypothetical protein